MIAELLPCLSAVSVERVEVGDSLVRIRARTSGDAVCCPGCGALARRVHSRYVRRVTDCAFGGRTVRIEVSVRRLYCRNQRCARVTFAEQVHGLTERYQRRTPALRRVLEAVAVALAGRAGARLARVLGYPVSGTTLLNLVMRIPDPPAAVPRVLGVDDLALRRGQSYATLLVDCESRLPIELWTGRSAEPLADWLAKHPGIAAVCRDGSSEYRAGITAGAPHALQVSDRFHLWQGLVKHVKTIVAAHRACLRAPQATDEPSAKDTQTPEPTGPFAEHARALHGAVHELLEQGVGIRETARRLGIGRHTAQRYARAEHWADMVKGWPKRSSILEPHHAYLLRRREQGQHNAVTLHRELQERGYQGKYNTVRDFVLPLRAHRTEHTAPPSAATPSVPLVTRWLTTHPGRISEDERLHLKQIMERCPELTVAHRLVRDFAEMLTSGTATGLPGWIDQARQAALPALGRFATGLEDDLPAVTAGLSTPHSSGVVEGRVTDVKYLKRQMAGAAGIPLLRKRILLVAASRRASRPPSLENQDDPWQTPTTKIL